MAKGRMVSATIGESRKFAQLVDDTHRLYYLMMLPHVDREGRLEADPLLIASKCLTRLQRSPDDVLRFLADAQDVGLLELYETTDHVVLQVIKFHAHNTPHHREVASLYPPPESGVPWQPPLLEASAKHDRSTDDASPMHGPYTSEVCPPKAGELKGIEVKGSKGKGIEPSRASVDQYAGADAVSPAATRARPIDYDAWKDAWNDNSGPLPKMLTVNDTRRAGIRRLVKEAGDGALDIFRDAVRAVAHDDYWVERQFGVDTLLRPGKAQQRAEQWRSGLAQIKGDANRKLARTAAAVANARRRPDEETDDD